MKRCKKCKTPLEGFLFCFITYIFGIKQSEKNPELCNKCEDEEA